ncbi:hypothetical protein J3R83DRAFT_4626 [Lanmaoa asiatica]|nr:hypothetical protein J3R83DRAFT_4626 [Lanmaoa asiatica]
MTITESAILVLKSPPDFSDPTLQSLLQKLSAWQSECSCFPLLFFINPDDPHQVHLVTGWVSVAAHEARIRGERNQELLHVFAPHVDMPKIRMVHLDVDFEAIPKHAEGMFVELFGCERAPSIRIGENSFRSSLEGIWLRMMEMYFALSALLGVRCISSTISTFSKLFCGRNLVLYT